LDSRIFLYVGILTYFLRKWKILYYFFENLFIVNKEKRLFLHKKPFFFTVSQKLIR